MKIYPKRGLDFYTISFLESFNKYTLKHRIIKYLYPYLNPIDRNLNSVFTLLNKSVIYLVDRLPLEINEYEDIDSMYSNEIPIQIIDDQQNQFIFHKYKPEAGYDIENIKDFRLDKVSQIEIKSYKFQYYSNYYAEKEINIYINKNYLFEITSNENIRCLILISSILYNYFQQNYSKDKIPFNDNSLMRKALISQLAIYKTIYYLAEYYYNDKNYNYNDGLENLYIVEQILNKQPYQIKWGLNLLKINKLSYNHPEYNLTKFTSNQIASLITKNEISDSFISEWIYLNKSFEYLHPKWDSFNSKLNKIIKKEQI